MVIKIPKLISLEILDSEGNEIKNYSFIITFENKKYLSLLELIQTIYNQGVEDGRG